MVCCLLSAEITLMVRTGARAGADSTLPGQFDGLPDDADGFSNTEFIGD